MNEYAELNSVKLLGDIIILEPNPTKTDNGIIIPDQLVENKVPKGWRKIVKAGEDCLFVKSGDEVLITPKIAPVPFKVDDGNMFYYTYESNLQMYRR